MEVEGGRLAVRVDGRAAAKPLAPGESERLLSIDGEIYVLHRYNGAFSLIPPMPVPSVSAVPSSRQAALRASTVMWGIVALIAVAPFLWYVVHSTYKNTATRRVTEMLNHMHD